MVNRGVARKLAKTELRNYKGPIHYISHHEVLKQGIKSPPVSGLRLTAVQNVWVMCGMSIGRKGQTYSTTYQQSFEDLGTIKFTTFFLDALPRSFSFLQYISRCVLPKSKLQYELGIFTGALCCIVKLPNEVCVSHTKREGEIKKLYNYSSQSTAHQLSFC